MHENGGEPQNGLEPAEDGIPQAPDPDSAEEGIPPPSGDGGPNQLVLLDLARTLS